MENKYNCDAYDDGYCYRLGRPLSDNEDDKCEDCCICDTKYSRQLNHAKGGDINVITEQ